MINISSFYLSLIIALVLFLIAFLIRNKRNYATFLGVFTIIVKIMQILYFSYLQKSLYYTFNIGFVGIALIFSIIFLLNKSNLMYNIAFFFSYFVVADLVSFAYGNHIYKSNIQNLFVILLEFLIILSIVYGSFFLGKRISYKGYISSIILFIIIVIIYYFKLHIVDIDIMDLIASLNFLNYELKLVAYTILNLVIMSVMYTLKR